MSDICKMIYLPKPVIKRTACRDGEGLCYELYYEQVKKVKKVKRLLIEDWLKEGETYDSLEKITVDKITTIKLIRKESRNLLLSKKGKESYDIDYAFNLLKSYLIEKQVINREDVLE